MAGNDVFEFGVAFREAGMRLDAFAAGHLPDCSRSFAALLIRQGRITVDTLRRKPSYRVKVHEQVRADFPLSQPVDLVADPMELDLLFEDAWIIVVNKPAGLVVHPAAGHPSGTLVNGLLYHCPDLEGIGAERRPGIVHRLDKDTSGAIVVAKTVWVHHELARQFKARRVRKRYLALVHGVPEHQRGTIDFPVGRHPVDRKKMSIVSNSPREALTLWRVKEQYPQAALLEVDLKTGRTHQIRVHCQAMGHPIIGDPVYGVRRKLRRSTRHNDVLLRAVGKANRQMLHALGLELIHPATTRTMTFKAPLPKDMVQVINALKQTRTSSRQKPHTLK